VRLALVADWLTTFGGAERTLAEFHALWPQSPIFTTVAKRDALESLKNADIRTTRLQTFYRIVGKHQVLLPLMPRAIEEIDLEGFDVVLSSSHAVAKGVIVPPGTLHVCYCHTPMRYAWEMETQYLKDFHLPSLLRKRARKELSKLRRWDLSTAKRVDVFLANSTETASRIERIYGRHATVVTPPVHDRFFSTPLITGPRQSFLAVGRFVPYKRFDLLIELANARKLPLTIVGKGQEEERLKDMAGPTVTFKGRVSDEELPGLYANAKAVLFPTHEDAGIVPLEAQACGTPVIAYGRGGTLDTVIEGKTGIFFDEQSVQSLSATIDAFAQKTFDPQAIRTHSRKFASTGFRERVKSIVEEEYDVLYAQGSGVA
jgi:glycosyltransferase involved in cell wall biosynthesis